MKKFVGFIIAVGCIAAFASVAGAGNTATPTVSYEVTAINELSVSASPTLTINTATAGSEPTLVLDVSTTYSITTNGTGKKITAAITTDGYMPTGATLTVALAAPTGATTAGDKALSTAATDVVTAITTVAESAKTITYKLSATVAAGVVSSASKTVTFTIADGGS